MSRLTSRAPFNRPSALDVLPARPAPLSPPETEMEPGLPHDENYVPLEAQQGSTETPIARFRKVSTVAYTSSGLLNRESRFTQRQSRWLVMVMPPASLTREPPVLGHTLSSAPAGRFSNGILMPLFPTLYGQLTAIAREFNMPSTTGVCIYLQLQDSGTSVMTPRISDESWQLLWGHFFAGDERVAPLPSHGLPISGRVEFDIDLRRARWFNSWMGHPVRERGESEFMSREPSIVPTHWRGDSRTSVFKFPTEPASEESPSPPDASGPAPSSRTALQRHLPRPLLLERRETSSVRSFSRHPSRGPSVSHEIPSPEPPNQAASTLSVEPTFVPNALSPVVQEQEEPQTAKKAELDSLVRQWRESSVTGAASTALAAAGQPSLDPVNMPPGTDVELDLNDFAWSISSAGPPLDSPVSPDWPEPLPSVHLLGRLQGSVCLTPSVCTSFGPLDYDWPESPVSCVSRRPSPDLGMRMMDFVPLTPTTATSWGPDDLPSPTFSEFDYEYRAPSVDLGVRGMGSCPVTPSTATSWGPADSPLFLPASPYHIRTPDVGERTFPDLEIGVQEVPAPVYPYYSAWTIPPWGYVWPYQAHRRREGESVALSMPAPRNRSQALLPEWPDFAALYPSDPTMERAAANKSQPVQLLSPIVYPNFELYPVVYPYNLDEIYPPARQYHGPMFREPEGPSTLTTPYAQDKTLLPEWPDFAALYPSDPKAEQAAANKSQPVILPGPVGYPFIDLYPIVYPHTLYELYPSQHSRKAHVQDATRHTPRLRVFDAAPIVGSHTAPSLSGPLPEWPDFAALYPADPKTERAAANKSQLVQLQRSVDYPFLEVYPPVYPYNLDLIYLSLSLSGGYQSEAFKDQNSNQPVHRTAPVKGTLPEWPDFASLYPADPNVERAASNKSQPVTLQRHEGYPSIVLYATVYPHNLQEIYPPVHGSSDVEVMDNQFAFISSQLLSEYPDFTGLYPSDPFAERVGANKSQPVGLPNAGYPFLTIYSSVYPFNVAEIYGPCHSVDETLEEINLPGCISIRLPVYSGYPTFNLYPASPCYPTFEIYPPIDLAVSSAMSVPSVKLASVYPAIELYEPIYPHLIIYPQTQLTVVDDSYPVGSYKRTPTPGPGRHRLRIPSSSLPTGHDQDTQRRSSRSPVKRALVPPPSASVPLTSAVSTSEKDSSPWKSRRTHLDLHLAVFGADSQPALPITLLQNYKPRRQPKRTHHNLHMMVFGNNWQENLQQMEDVVPELPSRSAPVPVLTRQRSRSGTVSSRPSAPTVRPSLREPADLQQPPPVRAGDPASVRLTTGRSRRPSVSTSISPSLSGASSNPSDPHSHPVPSSGTAAPLLSRRRSPSVSGLPSSPGESKSVLSRVRSMNTPVRPDAASPLGTNVGTESRGLDRSKSLSDANHVGTNRRSIVFERAKMFTVSEQGSEENFDVPTNVVMPPTIRPISKLDRSKLPFA